MKFLGCDEYGIAGFEIQYFVRDKEDAGPGETIADLAQIMDMRFDNGDFPALCFMKVSAL